MAILFPFLRFVHIAAAIFWVGTSLFMLFFLEPTIRSLGADGGKFGHLQKLRALSMDGHEPVSYTHLTLPTSDLV